MNSRVVLLGAAILALLSFAACGGGSINNTVNPTNFTISATVTGLTGTLVLQDNGSDNLTVTADGTAPFATQIAKGATYAVTVLTQPSGETCSLGSNATGTANANVTVAVTCTSSSTFTIGGTVSGLTGTLVLQDNGGDNLSVPAPSGSFTFATPVAAGSTYAVTVLTPPAGQICTVLNGTGTANANVTNIVVTCSSSSSTFTIGGTVSGLTGTGLALQDNGGDNLAVTASGSFTFATPVAAGSTYAVTVLTQPIGQTCTVTNGSGTAIANVTNVGVTCSAVTFTIGGTVSGLTGTGLVLQNNGGNNLSVTANGSFTFTTPLSTGSTYAVTVLTQPSSQVCTVSNGTGTATANVTSVVVTCGVTPTLTLSAAVTGLSGTLVLQDDAGKQLTFTTSSTQAFSNLYASGATYSVTVLTQPTTQTCTVGSNGSGTITANTTVTVTCAANPTISATVAGLTGTLVLQDDKNEQLTFTTNTTQTFPSAYLSGSTYAVTVFTQPTGQTCTLSSNATGTITANVTVTATCVSNFTLSVTPTGLVGTLVVQDSQSDQLSFTTNTTQTFTKTYASGAAYSVTVLTQPTGQTCTLSGNASGTITANTTVTATCTTNVANYTISVAVSGLTGTLVMQDDKADNLTFTTNTTQAFATQYAGGSTYSVSVKTQPSGQICSLSSNSNGTITANTTVTATCAAGSGFTIGGTLYDLSPGGSTTGVVLQNNNADNLTLTANGVFTFATPVASGGAYDVTVFQQPSSPEQSCTVNNGSGNASANVTNIQVVCLSEWTWMAGSKISGQQGNYKSPGQVPGSREGASTWVDSSGNLWLFGGFGHDNTPAAESIMSDLWEFTGGAWKYVIGPQAEATGPTYPSSPGGVGTPGARAYAASWIDSSGNLWLFGGYGLDVANTSAGAMNDIWEFTAGQWHWQGGSQTQGQAGSYITKGAPGGFPGGRYWSSWYTDKTGKFWLMGGNDGVNGSFNDLWTLDISNPILPVWTWVSGSSTFNQKGTYTGSSAVPGARVGASAWVDSAGTFWLFGGDGSDSAGNVGELNDLWTFSASKWTSVGGSTTVGGSGAVFGTLGVPDPTNVPQGRLWASSWLAPNGDVWLLGGQRSGGALFNDLWKYDTNGNWTWMGPTADDAGGFPVVTNQRGVYGTLGTPSDTNAPGSRELGAFWTDSSGNLWLFGGFGIDSAGTIPNDVENDLWKFVP